MLWVSGGHDFLNADKLGIESRLPFLKEHRERLFQIFVQLIQRFPLRMSSGKPGYVPDVEPGVPTPFDYCGKAHGVSLSPEGEDGRSQNFPFMAQ